MPTFFMNLLASLGIRPNSDGKITFVGFRRPESEKMEEIVFKKIKTHSAAFEAASIGILPTPELKRLKPLLLSFGSAIAIRALGDAGESRAAMRLRELSHEHIAGENPLSSLIDAESVDAQAKKDFSRIEKALGLGSNSDAIEAEFIADLFVGVSNLSKADGDKCRGALRQYILNIEVMMRNAGAPISITTGTKLSSHGYELGKDLHQKTESGWSRTYLGILLVMLAGQTARVLVRDYMNPSLPEQIRRAASALNKKLPIQVDSATRLESVEPSGNSLTYNYTVSGRRKAGRLKRENAPSIFRTACAHPENKKQFSKGIRYRYLYHDEDGIDLFGLDVNAEACAQIRNGPVFDAMPNNRTNASKRPQKNSANIGTTPSIFDDIEIE